jgi:hypothetical protein
LGVKAIGWLIGIVLLIVVALGVFLVLNSGALLKRAVETLGPEYLGVDVRLDDADISLRDGTGELRGLVIGNPPGFDGPYAFSLGRITLGLDPMAQSEQLIVLRDVEVDAADLALIAQGRNTNLQAILANLESDKGTGEPSPAEGESAAPKIVIDHFAFTNARTSLNSDILGETSVDLPDIVLNDIGRKSNGVTIREALKQLLQPIVRASTQALAKKGLKVDEIKANAEERLDKELKDRLGTNLESLKDRLP